jgi:hypothetical protein
LSARTASTRDDTGKTSSPATIAASPAFDAGKRIPASPSRRAAAAIGRPPVQRELAQQHEIGDLPALDDALGGEDPERDRQVE